MLFVAPEAAPFAKAGGLGEVMFALPRALQRLGHDARVIVPRYGGIDLEKFQLELELEGLVVPTGSTGEKENEPAELICNIRRYLPRKNAPDYAKLPVPTYFLENQEYYEKRSNIYGYSDDAVRWALLCRGTLEFVRQSRGWTPEIIIASDWQTGFLPNYLRTAYPDDTRLKNIATIFIIHNLWYQGLFDHRFVPETELDDGSSPLPSFFDPRFLKLNGMRRGIRYADVISTVSPTYAKEIMTKEYGELLEELLKERRSRLHGILNGLDYDDLNPETDPQLAENYDSDSLDRRWKNKLELQSRFGLPKDPAVPVLAIVSRLTEQKGFDLLPLVTETLLAELEFQLIVIGMGEAKYMSFFKELTEKFPNQVASHLGFDPILPRLAYGGADFILIPSRFEPCGLTQMEAMRYGVVPIVRKTGGLADSVKDYSIQTGKGTGFAFNRFDPLSLTIAVTRAVEHYRNSETWLKIQRQAMKKDFSWDKSAAEYSRLLETALDFHRRAKNV